MGLFDDFVYEKSFHRESPVAQGAMKGRYVMMEAMIDFLRAALPWIAIGLILAVFFVRYAGKEKKEEQPDNYATTGMCLGMCFGTAIGTAMGNNTGIGISLGMMLGLAVGSCIKKEGHSEDKDE